MFAIAALLCFFADTLGATLGINMQSLGLVFIALQMIVMTVWPSAGLIPSSRR
jgi:hypothetical protein